MDHRTKLRLKFEPEGLEVPGPIRAFQLVLERDHQIRRNDRENWRSDVPKFEREVVADGITRAMLSDMIADGADWLSYIEGVS